MNNKFSIILEQFNKMFEKNNILNCGINLPVFDIGLSEYTETYDLQKELLQIVIEKNLPGLILFVEHPPVITMGTSGKIDNLLVPESFLKENNIDLIYTDRGGDITFHGPGQLIIYPIINLNYFQKDLGYYVFCLEEITINILKHYFIDGQRIAKHRGVFVGNKKIASVGVRAKKWVTMHGLSLNASVDLKYFNYIIACGLKDYIQTSIQQQIGHAPDIKFIKEQLLLEFAEVFKIKISKIKF